MQSLPTDIKLNIVEFGSSQYPLKLDDQALVERIKQYDPIFDYKQWQKDIALKKDTLGKVLTPELKALYKYIREKGISVTRSRDTVAFVLRRDMQEDIRSILKYLSGLIAKTGYKVVNKRKYRIDAYSLDLLVKLMFISAITDSKGVYNYAIENIQRTIFNGENPEEYISDEFDKIMSRINILATPLTLARYLQYVIQRKEQLKKTTRDKLYPLYIMLQKHIWHIRKSEKPILEIYDVKTREDIPMDIIEELSRYFPTRYDYEFGILLLHMENGDFSNLRIIDRFFHPYIPRYLG